MNVPELIRRKRQGENLAPDELKSFIDGYVSGDIPDYQVSAFLMAVFFQGMSPEEAAALTRSMLESGDVYDLSPISGPKMDKHSTGGVGDKVSIILAPLAAAAGLVVPMVSGRGLGHSGGTLDKLDSIPGYRWNLQFDEFRKQLDKVGCAIIGQTDNFVPADKKLYRLRDVTATVESIPLICGSILSKKVAAGTEGLVMDVKTGSGAFMATLEDAQELAKNLVAIGSALGKKVSAVLTQMNQPLGWAVGNALEIRESVDLLYGKGPEDSREITVRLTAEMLVLAGKAANLDEAETTLKGLLDNGKALEKFQEWIAAQGGDPAIVDDLSKLEVSADVDVFEAPSSGHVQKVDTRLVGVAGNVLGGGRMKFADEVDTGVGFLVHKKPGDAVESGEPVITIHHRGGRGLEECKRLLAKAYEITDIPTGKLDLILDHFPAE